MYSFIGWLYETILCSISEKRLVKRGFLYGPYCPVYGFGAILDVLAMSRIAYLNPILLFFIGMILNCSLEYFTGWLLETIFHARWWDYNREYPFGGININIKGRVCLFGAIVFGIFAVIGVKIIQPFFDNIISLISDNTLVITVLILICFITIDLLVTVIKLSEFNIKLAEIQKYIIEKVSIKSKELKNHIDENQKLGIVKDKLKEIAGRLTKYDLRLLKSFPKFRSTLYQNAVKKIREYIHK